MIDGVELANDAGFCRWQLDQLQEHDLDAPWRFVDGVRASLAQARTRMEAEAQIRTDHARWGTDVSGGVPLADDQLASATADVETRATVLPFLDEALAAQRRDDALLLAEFDAMSVETTVEILRLNRQQVEGERAHYGVSSRVVEQAYTEDVGDHGWRKRTRRVTEHSMGAGTAVLELAAAARMLVDKRRAIAALEGARDASVAWKEDRSRERLAYPSFANPAFGARSADLDRARTEYAQLLGYLGREFPVLASYPMGTSGTYRLPAFRSSDEAARTAELAQIAAGPGAPAAQVVGARIATVLANIDRSLQALGDGDLKPWKLTAIVGATKLRLGVVAGSARDALIDRQIRGRVEDEALWNGLYAAFTIGLGLIAAIPTGGLSLGATMVVTGAALGTAALGAYGIHAGLKEYEVLAAARDSAFDRAHAISQADPSLFWVGVAIVGFGLDLGAAARAFGAVAPAARGLRAATTVDDVVVRLDELRRLGNRAQPGLGDELTTAVLHDPAGAAPLVDPQLDNNILSALANPADELHAVATSYARTNMAAGLSANRSVYREFLAKFSKYQFDQLRAQYGIRLIRDLSVEELDSVGQRLQNAFAGGPRRLKAADARAAASAFLTGERMGTSDLRFYKRARDLGLDVDYVGAGDAAAVAAAYVPDPVVIP